VISYRVKLADDDGTVLVTSPDFPELTTFGETTEDALGYALGAFEEAIEARISAREEIPSPSKGKSSDLRVALPLQAELKVLLYQNMFRSDIRKADLARLMRLPRQEIDRLLDLNHATNFTKIEKAFAALGKSLTVEVLDTR
jgi:antitoxin HicB